MTARDTAEPCTRLAAVEAGWRFAGQHPGEVMVLQHTGAHGNRWQCPAASLEHGRAVAEFKRLRETVVHGAIALWHNGRVSRYETGTLTRTGT